MEGLQRGNVTIQEGESLIELFGFDSDRRLTAGPDLKYLRTTGKLDPHASRSLVQIRRLESCKDLRNPASVPDVTETFLLEEWVDPGESFRFQVEVAPVPGVYTATLLAESPPPVLGIHYSALSQSLTVSD